MTRLIATLTFAAFLSSLAESQTPAPAQTPAPSKIATAVRLQGALRLDGKLDDAQWSTATPISDFVQKDPVEGAVPNDKMEVRFLYDDAALYVGTRVVSKDPAHIQAPVSRRD